MSSNRIGLKVFWIDVFDELLIKNRKIGYIEPGLYT